MDRKKSFYTIADLACIGIGFIYVLLSRILNPGAFGEIRPNVGIEIQSYAFPETGSNLYEDKISRIIVFIYSHVLAIALISVGLMLAIRLGDFFIKHPKERVKILFMCVLTVTLTIILSISTYPLPMYASMDTCENFMFARAWLPRYWHGFLTNVVYCAELMIVSHPVCMVAVPTFVSLALSFYCLYNILIKRTKFWPIITILWIVSLFVLLPTLETIFFTGRNYMYGIALFALVAVIFSDWTECKKMTIPKALWLAVFGAAVITWRGEGIIWILFLPVIIITVYLRTGTKAKTLAFSLASLFVMFLILWLPAKYGNDKYQGKDYYIVNTGSPLGAILNTEGANLSYSGADKDLENIDNAVPIDWISAFGCQSFQLWNAYNCRLTFQGGTEIDSEAYLKSAYNVMLHNPKILLKERILVLENALMLPTTVDVKMTSQDFNVSLSDEAAELTLQWHEYRDKGYNYIADDHGIEKGPFAQKVDYVIQILIGYGLAYFGYIVLAVNVLIIALVICSLIRKEWIFSLFGVGLLGTVFLIFLASPAGYPNYYFYSFFSEYWLLLIYVVNLVFKRRAKATNN